MQKKTVASVSFTGTASGQLDESELDPEEHTLSEHYLYGSGDTKSDFSYPVVDASKDLRRGNVESAWELGCRGDCPSDETHRRKLKKLGQEFDSNPIPDDAYENTTSTAMSTSTETIIRDRAPDDDRFEKRVTYEEKNDTEQIARGAVLVPDRLDHQGDFIRESTIREIAADYEARFEAGDALPGVMHAVFPQEAIELEESRVLEESEAIGGTVLPAGSWVQAYKFTDDRLWGLVEEGVLSGNSIGGTAKGTIHEPGTLPDDVEIPDAVQAELDEAGLDRDEIVAREITEGRVLEVSAVDHPAVPDASHEEHKSLEKGHPALTESVIAARLYLEQRGHSEDDARRLAEVLQEYKGQNKGLVARAKAWLGGGDDGHAAVGSSTPRKDGRTLSAANVRSVKAVHDATLDMLERSDVDHGRTRFTDDAADDFDIADYGSGKARELARNEPADTGVGSGADADSEVDMTEDNITEQIEALNDRLDEIDEKLSDESDDEQTEEQTKADEDDEPSTEEKVDQLAAAVEQMAGQIEQMASAQGVSQQADQGKATKNEDETAWGASPFAAGGGD